MLERSTLRQYSNHVKLHIDPLIGAAGQGRGQEAAQGKLAVERDIRSKEVQTILARADSRRPLLVTAILTGMCSSELRGLSWVDVDFGQKLIHICERADHWGQMGAPKSAAGDRKIPMSPMVANALKEWQLACPRAGAGQGPGSL